MTVDEILAQREYRDRCGREWNLTDYWVDRATFDYVQMWLSPDRVATQDEMRLLIERDMHRDVCGGIAECYSHPVVSVIWHRTYEHWLVFNESSFYPTGAPYDALEDALRDASALAVSSD